MTEQMPEPGAVGDTTLGVPGEAEEVPTDEVDNDDTDEGDIADDEPEEVEDGVEDDEGTDG